MNSFYEEEEVGRKIMKNKHILFVCTGNIDRSPTAEALLRGKQGLEACSAGTSMNAYRRLSPSLIDWADIIFAMEERHRKAVLTISPGTENKIIVLDIPDIYPRDNPELVNILKEKLKTHLNTEI